MGLILVVLQKTPVVVWAILAFVLVIGYGAWQRQRAITATKAVVVAEEKAKQTQAAREQEAKYNAATRETADVYVQNIVAVQRNAATLREQLGRLRMSIAAGAASAASSSASSVDGARAARSVADECVVTLAEVAEAAGRCTAKVVGLQSYINDVK